MLNFVFTLFFVFSFVGCQSAKVLITESADNTDFEIHPLAILQGLTTSSEVQFSILSSNKYKLSRIVVSDGGQKTEPLSWVKLSPGLELSTIHKLKFGGLSLDKNYNLIIYGEDSQVLDQRHFETVNLNKTSSKIVIASCFDDRKTQSQKSMWNQLDSHQQDYQFFIGDNVYADKLLNKKAKDFKFEYADENQLWKRYVETWTTLQVFRQSHLTPTLAIWDDHDYGFNNGGKNYPHKRASLKVFQSFYAQEAQPGILEPTLGAGYIFKAFGQNFIFIDNRFFRDVPSKTLKVASHLGLDQYKKIFETLSKEVKPTWLIQGGQFFGAYHRFESYESQHPIEFQKFLTDLKNTKSPVFLVSGDRHLSELQKIRQSDVGYETYELTSSALHASVFPGAWLKEPNPKRHVHGASGVLNYALVQTQVAPIWSLDVQAFGPDKKKLYQKSFEIKK